MSIQRPKKKPITIIDTKEYNNTIFFFYLHYLNQNLIVLRGLSYLLLML